SHLLVMQDFSSEPQENQATVDSPRNVPMVEAPSHKSPKVPPRRVAIVVAAAVIVAVLVWVLASSGSGKKNGGTTASAVPTAATQVQLEQLAAKVKHPIYW